MRADRLLSILFLLQSRGRLTAEQLADELEVSARTVYRDIDALSVAGVPVFADRGPGGGYALLDNYRTNLTGLTEAEVRALFMLSVPAPLADIGVDQELKTALRKVLAALPAVFRADETWVRRRFYLDTSWWFQSGVAPPHLQVLYAAIKEDRQAWIHFRPWFAPPAEIEQLVDPYGLVAKAGIWYLVYAYSDRLRVQRVANLSGARLADHLFQRPDDFDLAAFWEKWRVAYEASKEALYPVTVYAAPELIPLLRQQFSNMDDEDVEEAPRDGQGRLRLVLPFESLEAARAQLLGYGGAAEVLQPEALRRSIADFANQILRQYEAESWQKK